MLQKKRHAPQESDCKIKCRDNPQQEIKNGHVVLRQTYFLCDLLPERMRNAGTEISPMINIRLVQGKNEHLVFPAAVEFKNHAVPMCTFYNLIKIWLHHLHTSIQ